MFLFDTYNRTSLHSRMIYILFCLSKIYTRQNAVILVLCRNGDLKGMLNSLADFEKMFNSVYKYPYVFLNDDVFTDDFKESIKRSVSSTVEFGQLTKSQWGPPPWIDKNKMEKNFEIMKSKNVVYGGSLSYRNMCRFFAGHFYKHDLVLKYDYYWRIEPDVKFFCKLSYDPFDLLADNNKLYGFVISINEYMETIPSLWKITLKFLKSNLDILKNKKIMKFIFNENNDYNGCHFWSNFEIANFKVFRNELYEKFFQYLDESGGFYYERWGDAPIHTLAAILFLNKDEIHYFDDIGYQHGMFKYCPVDRRKNQNCNCDPKENYNVKFIDVCFKKYLDEMMNNRKEL